MSVMSRFHAPAADEIAALAAASKRIEDRLERLEEKLAQVVALIEPQPKRKRFVAPAAEKNFVARAHGDGWRGGRDFRPGAQVGESAPHEDAGRGNWLRAATGTSPMCSDVWFRLLCSR
jgi:hypothetical protein